MGCAACAFVALYLIVSRMRAARRQPDDGTADKIEGRLAARKG